MALCKSTIICENPQIFAVEVHKYFCFLRHSFGPSPDVYNNVLPLDLPTVYCPELDRGALKKHLEIFIPLTHIFSQTFFTYSYKIQMHVLNETFDYNIGTFFKNIPVFFVNNVLLKTYFW